MSLNRKLQYSLAINEALHQLMKADKNVVLIGQGVKSPWYVGNTCRGLIKRFGVERIIDTPVSENAMTGAAVGASIAGLRAISVHPRMDFMLYAFDPIINEAANWRYMSGGNSHVPVVIWGIINRGGEQGAQHSQSIHALFAHIPGLKVVMPSTAYDAKGLLIAAVRDDNPVVFIDDRWLYETEEVVPEEIYEIEIGKGVIRRSGTDVTLVSISYMAYQSMIASEELSREGISVEMIDLRSAKPIDESLVIESVKKTGRLVVADGGWRSCGISAEVAAFVAEKVATSLRSPIVRITLPDTPAPASRTLEEVYYKRSADIVREIKILMSHR